jgi:steroid delta-isomerase-like uncharacterized protein
MSAQTNEKMVRDWVEAGWNTGDLSMVDRVYAPDYALHGPGTEIRTPEAFKRFFAGWHTGLPDMHMTVEDLIASGSTVVWRFRATGTHRGEVFGIAPTGKQVTFTGIVITRFADGKWAEDWFEADFLGLLQQLGAVPAPATA